MSLSSKSYWNVKTKNEENRTKALISHLVVDLLTELYDVFHPFVLLPLTKVLVNQPAHMHPIMVAGQAGDCSPHLLPQELVTSTVKIGSIPGATR